LAKVVGTLEDLGHKLGIASPEFKSSAGDQIEGLFAVLGSTAEPSKWTKPSLEFLAEKDR